MNFFCRRQVFLLFQGEELGPGQYLYYECYQQRFGVQSFVKITYKKGTKKSKKCSVVEALNSDVIWLLLPLYSNLLFVFRACDSLEKRMIVQIYSIRKRSGGMFAWRMTASTFNAVSPLDESTLLASSGFVFIIFLTSFKKIIFTYTYVIKWHGKKGKNLSMVEVLSGGKAFLSLKPNIFQSSFFELL